MSNDFTYAINRIRFDENYQPSQATRSTTNFANLARGTNRQENLRKTLKMINSRFNALAYWDNSTADRYDIQLEIISVGIDIQNSGRTFPSIEILKTTIFDKTTNIYIDGIVGNNFSSYIRDYDFSILLLAHNAQQNTFSIPENFGELHGKLFKHFIHSNTYKQNFTKPPVICLSVSNNKTYYQTDNQHPVLGVEYRPADASLTEQYFQKMGLKVRYFMPPDSMAPLAFYFMGDLLSDYTNLELIGTISTMETFQKIYRPEIYNANAKAGTQYKPNLTDSNYSLTQIMYDREERKKLGILQGQFANEHFIKPYQTVLENWSASYV